MIVEDLAGQVDRVALDDCRACGCRDLDRGRDVVGLEDCDGSGFYWQALRRLRELEGECSMSGCGGVVEDLNHDGGGFDPVRKGDGGREEAKIFLAECGAVLCGDARGEGSLTSSGSDEFHRDLTGCFGNHDVGGLEGGGSDCGILDADL